MPEGTKDFRSRGELSFYEKGIFYMATGKSNVVSMQAGWALSMSHYKYKDFGRSLL